MLPYYHQNTWFYHPIYYHHHDYNTTTTTTTTNTIKNLLEKRITPLKPLPSFLIKKDSFIYMTDAKRLSSTQCPKAQTITSTSLFSTSIPTSIFTLTFTVFNPVLTCPLTDNSSFLTSSGRIETQIWEANIVILIHVFQMIDKLM